MSSPASASPAALDGLRWEVRQRLVLLETNLVLLGRVNTVALIRRFGISRAQASKDLALYQQLRPRNLLYDRFLKNYVITDQFEPLALSGTSSELLALLRAGAHEDGPLISLAGGMPSIEVLEPIERRVDMQVLAPLCRSIYAGAQVRLSYQSLSRDGPKELLLAPHALVYNGFRWHMRAWSETAGEFRDYLLARIRGKPQTVGPAARTAQDDLAWQTRVRVIIAPHPGLAPSQAEVITDDFGMVDGCISIELRTPLVPYYVRLMRIGSGDDERKPEQQQIILANKDEVLPYVTF
jgi:predicted DNA-binding transcriptional regulator YafY